MYFLFNLVDRNCRSLKDRMSKHFDQWKHDALSNDKEDLSRKHSIDDYIVELINRINNHSDYYTSSSCSGRTIVFTSTPVVTSSTKSDCQWLYVTHEQADLTAILTCLEQRPKEIDMISVKFEAFILHVICRTLDCAKVLLNSALECGYRNSGLVISNQGKITLAIRSTHALEVPVVIGGRLCVDQDYITQIVSIANEKMTANMAKIDKFSQSVANKLATV
jgi:tRNA wybutosine-synthesizing protein 3